MDRATVLAECAAFEAFRRAYLEGARGAALPALPKPRLGPTVLVFLTSTLLHSILWALEWSCVLLRLDRVALGVVKLRISTDPLSWEPGACRLHRAYTMLGILQVRTGDYPAAARSLTRSWQVHPCPHASSSGLQTALRDLLADRDDLRAVVRDYDTMARAFAPDRERP